MQGIATPLLLLRLVDVQLPLEGNVPSGSASSVLSIRNMGAADLAFVVEQHSLYFPDGFFARLGRRFLTEYYHSFLTGESAFSSIAEMDGKRVGYLVGTTSPKHHREHVVRRHGVALAWRAALAMLTRPRLTVHFLRTRAKLYGGKIVRRCLAGRAGNATQLGSASTAVLSHVAVVPDSQAQGAGTALLTQFEGSARKNGCQRILLVTASGQDGAGRYYRSHGWAAVAEQTTPDGRHLTTYSRQLSAVVDETTGERDCQ